MVKELRKSWTPSAPLTTCNNKIVISQEKAETFSDMLEEQFLPNPTKGREQITFKGKIENDLLTFMGAKKRKNL